jgi:hypothetical protein
MSVELDELDAYELLLFVVKPYIVQMIHLIYKISRADVPSHTYDNPAMASLMERGL